MKWAGLTGVACLHTCTITGVVYGQDEIVLGGQIRDFLKSHPDFGLAAGSGQEVTAMVDYYLNAGNMAYDGSGEKLILDALDGSGREIAPHMFAQYGEDTGVFVLKNPLTFSGNSTQDSYDPTYGYDPSTAKPLPPIDTVATIPNVIPPTFPVAVVKTAEMRYKKAGSYTTETITSGQYHTDTFVMQNGFELVIDGDVEIRVDSSFTVTQSSVLTITPGSTCIFHIGGDFEFRNSSLGNRDGWGHGDLQFLNFGTSDMIFDNSAEIVGTIVAPNSDVIISNSVEFFGAITANTVVQDNSSGIHIAGDFAWQGECWKASDTQGATSVPDTGDVTSPMSFATWFRDAPGINLTDQYQLIMTDNGTSYSFETTDWDPINGELYGNEGGPANRNFTVALQSIFLNDNCTSMFFEIETSMDAWVFVGEKMVIDLGGNTGSNRQRIDLDRLGLATDRWYLVRVFLAQRTETAQDLRIETTIPLTPPRDIKFRLTATHD